jgi:hypothetical protein
MYDHDRQAAEDNEEQLFGIIRLAYYKPGIFYGWLQPSETSFRSADPLRVGSAKTKGKAMFRNFKFYDHRGRPASQQALRLRGSNAIEDSAAGTQQRWFLAIGYQHCIRPDATDPTLVDAITFDIAPSSGSVVAAIVKLQTVTAGTWTDCGLAAGTAPSMSVTCTYGSLQLANVTALNIVASSTADTP